MNKAKIHYHEHLGKMSLCGMIWIKTTTNVREVTCKKCFKQLDKLASESIKGMKDE